MIAKEPPAAPNGGYSRAGVDQPQLLIVIKLAPCARPCRICRGRRSRPLRSCPHAYHPVLGAFCPGNELLLGILAALRILEVTFGPVGPVTGSACLASATGLVHAAFASCGCAQAPFRRAPDPEGLGETSWGTLVRPPGSLLQRVR